MSGTYAPKGLDSWTTRSAPFLRNLQRVRWRAAMIGPQVLGALLFSCYLSLSLSLCPFSTFLLCSLFLSPSLCLSLTHALPHSLTYSLKHSSTDVLTYSVTHALTHSLTHPPTHSHHLTTKDHEDPCTGFAVLFVFSSVVWGR